MSDSYVRIYNGPEGSNIIGFSASAVPEQKDDFPGFMKSHGYEVEEYEPWGEDAVKAHRDAIRVVGGVSLAYFGIMPPLQEEHQQALVEWVADHNSVYSDGWVIDNRATPPPVQPFSRQTSTILGSW